VDMSQLVREGYRLVEQLREQISISYYERSPRKHRQIVRLAEKSYKRWERRVIALHPDFPKE
jgi:hypothetical protein